MEQLSTLWVVLLLLVVRVSGFNRLPLSSSQARSSSLFASSTTESSSGTQALEKCLFREYTTFFAPMEKSFYSDNVEFIDPMTSFVGIDKYKNNVDMLAGRTPLGSILFKDASIALHKIEKLDDGRIQTRWTLRVTVKLLPWQPTPRFSGVSIYTLDAAGKICKQEDYWDSVNLESNKYTKKGVGDGIGDFLGQLQNEVNADMAAPELPYELLRRGKTYDVRRYPEMTVAQTTYDKRPEGYDRLGSYAGGSNELSDKLDFFSPTLMRIKDSDGKRSKVMSWPLSFAAPGGSPRDPSTYPNPTIPKIILKTVPSKVVAVSRFELAATEPIVRGFTGNLIRDVEADGMAVSKDAKEGECVVGQYDALFSLNKRRVEAWVELDKHPW